MNNENNGNQSPFGQHSIFISYSSKNLDIAEKVVKECESHGIKCWYAPRDIMPSDEWVSAIKNALVSAKVFLLIFTNESNESKQVMNEVALAFNEGKAIIPFKLNDTQMNNELEYYLTRVHWHDAVNIPLEISVVSLREYIEEILSRKDNISYDDTLNQSERKIVKKKNAASVIVPIATGIVVLIAFFVLIFIFVIPHKDYMAEGLKYYNSEFLSTEDSVNAKENFLKAAEKGNADAYYYLGMLSEREFNFSEAKTYYEEGIKRNSNLSRVGLAILYINGSDEIIGQDIPMAESLVNLAHAEGCNEANYPAGLLFLYDENFRTGKRDPYAVIEYYKLAYSENDEYFNAILNDAIADIYKNGFDGSNDNDEMAFEFYEKALESSPSFEGEVNLDKAEIYLLMGENEKAENCLKEAFDYFSKSAELGNISSMYELGNLYSEGKGCEKDIDKALSFYEEAALGNHTDSMIETALIYYAKGSEDESNYKNAYYYFNKALFSDSPLPDYYLGLMNENGFYVQKDLTKAKEYYLLAGYKGLNDSFTHLGNIYFEEGDLTNAIENYNKVWKENAAAAVRLGEIYYEGKDGVAQKDLQLARSYFEQADKLGFNNADMYEKLGYCCFENEEYAKSAEYFEKCFLINKDPQSAFRAGIDYFYFEDYNNAIKRFSDALDAGYSGDSDLKYYINKWSENADEETLVYAAKWLE